MNPEDSAASQKLAQEFGVTGFPAFFIYPQSGRPIRIRQHKHVEGEWVLMTPREFVRACQDAAAGKAQDDVE